MGAKPSLLMVAKVDGPGVTLLSSDGSSCPLGVDLLSSTLGEYVSQPQGEYLVHQLQNTPHLFRCSLATDAQQKVAP